MAKPPWGFLVGVWQIVWAAQAGFLLLYAYHGSITLTILAAIFGAWSMTRWREALDLRRG